MAVELSGKFAAHRLSRLLAPAMAEADGSLQLSLGEDCFLYPSAVAWLTSQLCRGQHDGHKLDIDISKNREVAAYLTRMDFFKHLDQDGNAIGKRRTAGGRFLPIKAIDDEDSVYDVVDAILDLLMMHFDHAREILPAVEWALNEITDNIVIHAESPSPGHVFAQFYPTKNILSVAITDAGLGLRQTLAEAHEVESDERALALAMERGVTRGVGQGNGIAGTRQILQVNGGRFAIWSGEAHHYESPEDERARRIPALPGTGLAMQFDTSRPIDLQETFIESVDFTYIEAVAGQISRDGASLQVANESSGFGGRSPARRLRRKITAILPDMEEPLTLDFSGINAVSSSYIDELLGKLIAEIGLGTYNERIRIANMAPSVARRANVTIGQRLQKMGLHDESSAPTDRDRSDETTPEMIFEGWLAIHPDKLSQNAEEVIDQFSFRWEIDLNDESSKRLKETLERVRGEEDEGD